MTEPSTVPIEVEGAHDASGLWQHDEVTWSFGPTRDRVVGLPDTSQTIYPLPDAENHRGSSTKGPQEITPAESQPVIIWRGGYGKRALHALYEWEGVVERVENGSFQCRIVPVTHGVGDPTKVEFTEFTLDDLATEGDRSLVVPGAIFYWTIGRSRNAAGTVTNLSLVRFRRLLPPTPEQARLAEQEAEDLLRALSDRDESDSAGGR